MGAIVAANGKEVCNFGNGETYYPTAGEEPCVEAIVFILNAVNKGVD